MSIDRSSDIIDVFISYHRSTNLIEADLLYKHLSAQGLNVFKDDVSLHASERWQTRLGHALSTCLRFVVLLGPRGLERWVGAETEVALARHFGTQIGQSQLQIVPVVLPGAPNLADLPLLGLLQGIDWSGDAPPPELLNILVRPLTDQEIDTPYHKSLLNPEICPYVGLSAFQKDQAKLFFGRERDVLEALKRLGRSPDMPTLELLNAETSSALFLESNTTPYRCWLNIIGGSGSGKSSLMRAGLLPLVNKGALSARTGRDEWIITEPMLPGEQPLVALAEVLAPALHEKSLDLLQKLRDGPIETLRLWLTDTLGSNAKVRGVLLAVDQFEEIFTLSQPSERARFDSLMHNALSAPDCPLHLISTCRSDYQYRITEDLPNLSKLLNTLTSTYALQPMDEVGLRLAITEPAKLGGIQIHHDLVQAVLDDAREDLAAALPLVQHAMETLWRRNPRKPGHRSGPLTRKSYEDCGRLGGILASEADKLLTELGSEHSSAYKGGMELLLALSHYHMEGRHTRQSLTWEQACRQASQSLSEADMSRGQQVLDHLSGQRGSGRQKSARLRLITITGTAPPATTNTMLSGDTRRVDLIHEALLRSRPATKPGDTPQPYWPRLIRHMNMTTHKNRDLLRQTLHQETEAWADRSRFSRLFNGPSLQYLHRYKIVQYLVTRKELCYLAEARNFSIARITLPPVGVIVIFMAGIALRDELSSWFASDNGHDVLMSLSQLSKIDHNIPIPSVQKIPLGEFDFGCKPGRDVPLKKPCPTDEPMHHVDLRKIPDTCTFMGTHEITQEQYNYFVWQSRTSSTDQQIRKKYPAPGIANQTEENLPVVNVSYYDAVEYTQWLSNITKQHWRLPTEEEWEYAARAPGRPDSREGAYWWGSTSPKATTSKAAKANCVDCDPRFSRRAAPVGSYAANPFGLHDTAGNVWEWTSSVDNTPIQNSPSNEPRYVLRGGSWGSDDNYVKSSVGMSSAPGRKYIYIGFRVCLVSTQQ